MKPIKVQDSQAAVEVIRPITPKDATSAPLKDYLLEEKKEETDQQQQQQQDHDPFLSETPNTSRSSSSNDGVIGGFATTMEVEEEGQEALWVEEAASPSGSSVPDADKGKKTPTKISTWAASVKNQLVPTAGGTTLNSHNKHSTTSPNSGKPTKEVKPKAHVLLLSNNQPNANTTGTPPKNRSVSRAALEKAKSARELLERALSSSTSNEDKKLTFQERQVMVSQAFAFAMEARLFNEQEQMPSPNKKTAISTDLQRTLNDAKLRGERAALAGLAQKQNQNKDYTSAEENDDAYVSRQCFEFILSDVLLEDDIRQSHAKGPTLFMGEAVVLDDISSIGYDNTFEVSPTGQTGTAYDVMSMSSLNEILDGPLESDQKANDEEVKDNAADGGEKTSFRKLKKPSVMGLFRHNTKKAVNKTMDIDDEQEAAAMANIQPIAIAKSSTTTRKLKNPFRPSKKAVAAPTNTRTDGRERGPADKDIERFVATVVLSEEDDQPNEPDYKDLKKVKGLDEKLEKVLRDAMANDDNESVTSAQGVPLHGWEEMASPDGDNKAKKKASEEESAVRTHGPPVDFSKVRPKFVTAPRGAPEILMQRSWESLEKEGAVPKREEQAVPPQDVNSEEIDPLITQLPSMSPASTGITGPTDDGITDRYIVNPFVQENNNDDKYAADAPGSCGYDVWSSCIEMITPVPDEPVEEKSPTGEKEMEKERYVPVDEIAKEEEKDGKEDVDKGNSKSSRRFKLFGGSRRKSKSDDNEDTPEPEAEVKVTNTREAKVEEPQKIPKKQKRKERASARVIASVSSAASDLFKPSSSSSASDSKPKTSKSSRSPGRLWPARSSGGESAPKLSKSRVRMGGDNDGLVQTMSAPLPPAPAQKKQPKKREAKLPPPVAPPHGKDKPVVGFTASFATRLSPRRSKKSNEDVDDDVQKEPMVLLLATSDDDKGSATVTSLASGDAKSSDANDSLLNMIKEQKVKQQRGLDPADTVSGEVRGIDP